ncbi:hypothetical protein E2P81_ATG04260 [Venturia nashicola]|uniref:Uncharacterized protein n=1 Tax=Venturia nashicola TaxID=86259 RepID=A0A4Z1P7R4_9PEZI|nr:hypothetical protein E6O75_ATG04362 [Venturia nashicola]TLD37448.1 hypothetical protein E2P81_ATG04260 [Venturia nashicola]
MDSHTIDSDTMDSDTMDSDTKDSDTMDSDTKIWMDIGPSGPRWAGYALARPVKRLGQSEGEGRIYFSNIPRREGQQGYFRVWPCTQYHNREEELEVGAKGHLVAMLLDG